MVESLSLSAYARTLNGTSKSRYQEKLAVCQLTIDPYDLDVKSLDADPPVIPHVQWSDLYVYMISTPSQHTKEEIRVSN